jgi:carboxypeptidase D
MPDSFPPRYIGGYLNSQEVQLELGVPLNATGFSATVFNGSFRPQDVSCTGLELTAAAYMHTGDFVSGSNLPYLGSLLDQGVKVALVYGDRDYQCNCTSASHVSVCVLRVSGN